MPFSDPESLALIARDEPEFFRHVEQAREVIDRFELVFSGHESQKPIVSACLWYALDRGVTITISPRIALKRAEPARLHDATPQSLQLEPSEPHGSEKSPPAPPENEPHSKPSKTYKYVKRQNPTT